MTFRDSQQVKLQVYNSYLSTLRINRAIYGNGNRSSDVTSRLNSQIQGGQLNLEVNNQTMGGDPAPGQAAPPGLVAAYKTMAVLATFGVVLGAWYMLWLVERVFFGPLRERYKAAEVRRAPLIAARRPRDPRACRGAGCRPAACGAPAPC